MPGYKRRIGWAALSVALALPMLAVALLDGAAWSPARTGGVVRTAQAGPPPVGRSPNTCLPGTGSRNWCGDGRPGTQAKLAGPTDVTTAPDGSAFIADTLNHVIRRVSPDGVIETVAGDGILDSMKDPEPAATASFDRPGGVAFEEGGSLLVADTNHDAIRRVSADGQVTTIVGGAQGVVTRLRRPGDVVALPGGSMLVVDTGRNRVLRISPAGAVRRVAGTGRAGFTRRVRSGSRSPLRTPVQVAPLPRGDMLIADAGNRAIRWLRRGRLRTLAVLRPRRAPLGVAVAGGRVLASHTTGVQDVTRPTRQSRVAGTQTRGFNGDSGPATETALDTPRQLATAPDGTLLLAEQGSDRVRRLRVAELVTIAGTDTPLTAAGSARRASISQRRCYGRHPRFQVFALVPQSRNVLSGSRRRVRVLIATSRRAAVKLRLEYRGTTKRRKSLKRVGNRKLRRAVLRARLKGGRRYRLRMEGTSFGDSIRRCDDRWVVVR